MTSLQSRLHQRSVALVEKLDEGHRTILFYWTILASLGCGIRLAVARLPALPLEVQLSSALPYALVIGAPIASILLAFHWFRDSGGLPQPEHRLARFGSWRDVDPAQARKMRLYGATGLMASLLVGILLNIPIRAFEFLAAMPALGASPPEWYTTLFGLMLADMVLLSSLYAIAFVAALRHVPLFPRLLATIWAIDIMMQIVMANVMGGVAGLPPTVAAPLHQLLEGNLQKVLISVAIWLPYLLLSKRVNLTYRLRVPV